MHHANYYYGHAHVLAQYCGLLDPLHPPRIIGYYQHGWNIGDGLAPGTPFVANSRIFLWSEQTRRRAWSQGRRNVIVTGAPFSYLVSMSPEPEDSQREGTIYYPFHGWEGQHVRGDHRRLIDEIRDVEPGPVTVCLYWHEYRSRRIRRTYERAGFRVICHGYRGLWWRDHDREFLARQLAELRRHKRVASNRLCSAVWYGVLAGCEPAVYGNPMILDNDDRLFGGDTRIRRQWPQLFGHTTDYRTCRELADAELGAHEKAEPAELAVYLGWSSAREDAHYAS